MHGTFRSFPLLLSSAALRTHPKEEMVSMPNGIHTLGWQWLQHTEIKEQHIESYVLPQALHLRLQMKPSWVKETALSQRFPENLMNHCWPNCSVRETEYPQMSLGVFQISQEIVCSAGSLIKWLGHSLLKWNFNIDCLFSCKWLRITIRFIKLSDF